MQKIVFFLRHNNDIDHITPIIYKWINTKNIATDIIITSDKKLLEDYRIKFLKEQSKNSKDINIFYFTDFLPKKYQRLYELYKFYSRYQKIKKFTTIDKNLEKIVDTFMERYFVSYASTIICFDWNADELTKLICSNAKTKFFITVALPHGDEPYWNKIQRANDINYKQAKIPYFNENFFDFIVVPNNLCKERYNFITEDRVKVLGSARYNDEWIKIHDNIKSTLPNFIYEFNKLKVLMFLRNKHWIINWEEVLISIKLITQFKEIFLCIKNHPRGKLTYNLTKKQSKFNNIENLYIDDDYNSSTLIDWCDIILDLGTSTCWEAIKKNKPVLNMHYLQGNYTTIGHYMPSSIIKSRDDIIENLRKFYKNKNKKFYTKQQKNKFIKEIINSNNKTLENYCNFLEGLFK